MLANECVVVKNLYGSYCVPLSSAYTYTSKAILSGRVHEPDTIKFIIDNCDDGSVIHAGTGFGDFIPALSNACKATVWSFEPEQENYFCAKKTIELNELTNVTLLNCGLGEIKNRAQLRVKESNKSLGPRCEIYKEIEGLPSQDFQEIDIVALDDIIPEDEKISIIHLDVEGYEPEVLKGAKNIISKYSPIVILEIHKEAVKYNTFMESIGYLPVKHLIYDAGPMVFVNTVYKKAAQHK